MVSSNNWSDSSSQNLDKYVLQELLQDTRLRTLVSEDPCVHVLSYVDGNNPPHLHKRSQRQGYIQNKNGKQESEGNQRKAGGAKKEASS